MEPWNPHLLASAERCFMLFGATFACGFHSFYFSPSIFLQKYDFFVDILSGF